MKDGRVRLGVAIDESTKAGMKYLSGVVVETQPDHAVEMTNSLIAVSLTPHIKK